MGGCVSGTKFQGESHDIPSTATLRKKEFADRAICIFFNSKGYLNGHHKQQTVCIAGSEENEDKKKTRTPFPWL
ncbi:hypothetical protein Y1Q_0006037 [Alligator mississippiensis]|uniref:Uncharacterized protein n=1 Tax=Alligator mississippiensis TaxID=8496 RepID=A0A151N3T8_ALLMI|nr:hypothetical protein Y1Q_0006037 [Alligator mississippiensis]